MKATRTGALLITIALATANSPGQSPSLADRCPPFFAVFQAGGGEPQAMDSTTGKVTLLKDINPGPAGSSPKDGVVADGEVYFWAEDRDTGLRIWKTDGAVESTFPLELDYPTLRGRGNGRLCGAERGFIITSNSQIARYSSDSGKLTGVFDPKLRFAEIVENSDGILARTQGTGYKKPSWIYEIPRGNSQPIEVAESMVRLDEIRQAVKLGQQWLCVKPGHLATLHDATSTGYAPIIKGISAAGGGIVLGKKLIFAGQELFNRPDGVAVNKYGVELFETDGTAAGTKLLKDILDTPGDSVGSRPSQITRCGKKVIFTIQVSGVPNQNRLWESDGTTGGTKLLAELPTGSSIRNITSVGEGAEFTVSTLGRGKDLWWTNGTAEGTRRIMEGGAEEGGLQKFADGVVFFGSANGKRGIWWSDGKSDMPQFIGAIEGMPYSLLRNGELFALLPGRRGGKP